MAQFKTIHTTYGLTRMAAAEASGVPINLTHMAIGDGNGNPTTPSEAQTALVREVFRSTVNRVYQDPDEPTKFTAELVVPADEGGWTMREVGIFDNAGSLFAVANLPDTYKPTDAEGAFSDGFVRLVFVVSNATIVTLQVDPNVAVASQTWIINNITPAFLLPGGLTHEVLRKVSNTDGDVEWAPPTETNIVVNVVEEEQTLSAAQVNIDLLLTNVQGLALYIEGVRLPKKVGADGWQPHSTIVTRAVLGQAYAAGTKVIAVQNEPASNLPDALEASQNLADVQSAATSRYNLGVYSKAETDEKTPVSAIMYFPRTTAPAGWLKANGAAISRTSYAALFAVIGTMFGTGDGFNTFNLPDLRGEFLRGWDDGRGVDPSRSIGTFQSGAIQSHSHDFTLNLQGEGGSGYPAGGASGPDGVFTSSTAVTGGTETRPRNRALLACIKF